MKRVKKIVGDDGDTRVTIDIHVDDYTGKLRRHEIDEMVEGLASNSMPVIASARYLGVRLSQLKVT